MLLNFDIINESMAPNQITLDYPLHLIINFSILIFDLLYLLYLRNSPSQILLALLLILMGIYR